MRTASQRPFPKIAGGTPNGRRGVEIAEHRGLARVPRCVFQRLLFDRPKPQQDVEANPVREHRRAEAEPALVGNV